MMSSKHGSDHARQPGESRPEALDGVWSLYYQRGYEDGHRQAIRDVLASLILTTEEFLGTVAGTSDARQLIYAYERHIERGLDDIARLDVLRRDMPPSGDAAPIVPPS